MLQIATSTHDTRTLASELQNALGQILSCVSGHDFTDESTSCEANQIQFQFVQTLGDFNATLDALNVIRVHVSVAELFNHFATGCRNLRRLKDNGIS